MPATGMPHEHPAPRTSKTRVRVWTVDGEQTREHADQLATEEPLEIRLLAGGERRTVAVTMRTPGADFALAAGFLFSEGVIAHRDEIRRITYCVDAEIDAEQRYNIVNVELRAEALPDLATLDRHFLTTSACGVCGKASLDALRLRGQIAVPPGPMIDAALITSLPERLRAGAGIVRRDGRLARGGTVR